MTSSVDSVLAKVERSALWTTTFLFPLLVLPGITVDEFKAPKMALLILGVGIAGAARLARIGGGTLERLDRRMLAAGALLLAPQAISWAFSDLKEWSLVGQYLRYQGLLPYALFAAFGLLVATAFRGRTRSLAWAICLSAGVTGLYSVIQAVELDPLFLVSGPRRLDAAFSTIGNTNFAGSWHAMTFPVAIGLIASEKGRPREVAVGLSALIALGIFLSFSEGPWVAAVGGSAVLAGLMLGRRFDFARGVSLLVAATLAVLVVAAVISVSHSDRALALFGATVQDRAWAWEAAVESWSDDPLVGRGPNTFALFAHSFSPFEERANLSSLDYRDDPHSVPLFFLASTGLLGLLGYAGAVGLVLRWTWIGAVKSADPLMMGIAAGLVSYGIQALVSLDDPTLRLAFWALAGAGLAGRVVDDSSGSTAPQPHRTPQIAAFVAAFVVLIGGCTASWSYLGADIAVRTGIEAALDNQADEATEAFERGLSLRDDDWYRLLAGRRTGELALRRGAEGEPLFESMQEHFAAMSVPRTPRALLMEGRLTNAWAENVDPAFKVRALELLSEAHRIDPGGVDSAVIFALALSESGRHDEALDVLRPYVKGDPAYTGFWETWALINARAGNEQAAWEIIQSRGLSVENQQVRRALELLIP